VEDPSVDLKTQIAILRKHNEYLTQLSTQISSLLTTAEQALAEPQSETPVSPDSVKEIANVLRMFSKEAEFFCGRINFFLETQEQAK
jgi:hypothetical protein